jgi:hypothetical protein
MNPGWTTNKLDKYNKNRAKICDTFGCRKHVRLVADYGGVFCQHHLEELQKIRSLITHKGDDFDARLEEIRFRKSLSVSHAHYAAKIEKQNFT